MEAIKIDKPVVKKVGNDGKINYYKKVDYYMNIYYTKLSQNIYKQLGIDLLKNKTYIDGKDKYIITEEKNMYNEIYLGSAITSNLELSKIKIDLKDFLLKNGVDEENVIYIWKEFLKMNLADIYTLNTNKNNSDWGILILNNKAKLIYCFDYDNTFFQNAYPMIGIAEAIENKNITNKMVQKYNIRKYKNILSDVVEHIGFDIGEGRRFVLNKDLNIKKYSIKETIKYIMQELGNKEYKELERKINIQKALPIIDDEFENKQEFEFYGLLAKLHICVIKAKLLNICFLEQEIKNINFLLSINSKMFSKYESYELIELIKKLDIKKDVKGAEIYIEMKNEEERKYCTELVKEMKKYNWILQIHSASIYDLTKEEIIDYLEYYNSLALIYNKKIKLTIHPAEEKCLDLSIEKTIEGMNFVSKYINENDLKLEILLENLNELNKKKRCNIYKTYEALEKLKKIGNTFDVGHFVYDYSNDYKELIKEHMEKTKNVHIHDISDDRVDHYPFYYNNVKLSKIVKYLELINYKGNVVLEYGLEYLKGNKFEDKIDEYIKQIELVKESFI